MRTYTNGQGQQVAAPFYNCEQENNTLPAAYLLGEQDNYMGKLYSYGEHGHELEGEDLKAWQAGWDAAQVLRDQWYALQGACGDNPAEWATV